MKKVSVLLVLLIVMASSTVYALDWAYPFVVWDGKVYEVKVEEVIEENEIGKVIGKVKTKPNDMTGSYYGNASNSLPKGTKYYEIKGVPTTSAIAVRKDDRWIKAVYLHKAPFHILNIFSNFNFTSAVVITALVIIIIRTQKITIKEHLCL